MKFAFFIARRVSSQSRNSFSRSIIRLAICTIAISMAIMIVSTSIVTGFKKEISEKVFGFWGHVHISNNYAASSLSFESTPLNAWQTYYESLDSIGQIQYAIPAVDWASTCAHNATFPYFWLFILGILILLLLPIFQYKGWLKRSSMFLMLGLGVILSTVGGIAHPIQLVEYEKWVQSEAGVQNIQQYASKEGIIKTKDEIEGIILRGVSDDFNFDYLAANLIKGDVLDFRLEHDILISKNTADRLLLDVGDSFLIYFVQNEQSLARRLTVKGIFKTGLEEYDKRFALVNISLIQQLNNWRPFRYYGNQYYVDGQDLLLKSIQSPNDPSAARILLEMDSIRRVQFLDSTQRSVLLPSDFAKEEGLEIGDVYVVRFKDQENDSCFIPLQVIGFNNEMDAPKTAYVSWHTLQAPNQLLSPQISGFEVFVEDYRDIDAFSEFINFQVLMGHMQYGTSIKDLEPNIFDWLSLTDTNERVILIFMLIVCIINMITSLLILILERTQMIGVLKALGASTWKIRTIFLYNAGYIICLGLLFGNVFGLGFCWLQTTFGIVTLPEELYYISVAPVELNLPFIIVLNIGTFILTLLVLILPTWLVSSLDPVKSIRFS